MGISFCVGAEALRKAIAEVEAAEANGFMHCLAVFDLAQVGSNIDQCQAEYSDLVEKGHPTDPNFNWGRFQGVTARHKLKRGKLVPL